jgi:S1-C subfamily serine protease
MKNKLVALLVLLVLGAPACSLQLRPSTDEDAGTGSSEIPRSTSIERSGQEPPHSNLSKVIEDTLPSVVNVRVRNPGGGGGEGSGVIIDSSGIILTNAHVVAAASNVKIVLNDDGGQSGEALTGNVVGTSPERDIAVVKVASEVNLPAIEIGRSAALRLGDEVIAIGFPLQLGGVTVTKGIISAQNRDIEVGDSATGGQNELRGLLQTDAAINPGNSGGALIDLNGSLVGINTAAAGASFAENIGFAIPIDRAVPVAEEIIGAPDQAFLGIVPDNLDSLVAQNIGVDPDTDGALIVDVIADTPAEEAGLDEGDVITAIDGEDIDNREDLFAILEERSPGEEVSLTVVSRSGERDVTLELGQRPVKVVDPEG